MSNDGYVYVPQQCAEGQPCRIHVAFHGCKQYAGLITKDFYEHAGYNEWADANNLIVLYPQTIANLLAPLNPNGCWDWWGYTGRNYATKNGVQIAAIKAMLERLAKKYDGWKAPIAASSGTARQFTTSVNMDRATNGRAMNRHSDWKTKAASIFEPPQQFVAAASTDTRVALFWDTVKGASGYNIYRAPCEDCAFKRVNPLPMKGTSFADHRLSAETSYYYKLRAINRSGSESPDSVIANIHTAAVPASCDPFVRDNMTHVSEGRALVGIDGHVSAIGSGEDMGLWNPFVETALRQIGTDKYRVGPCHEEAR